MATFQLKKGRNIQIKGEAAKEIVEFSLPKRAAVQPLDFRGLRPRLSVKVGDIVKAGSPVISDKSHPEIVLLSPISGRVVEIIRGEKRALLEIIIEADGQQESETLSSFSIDQIQNLSRDEVVKTILKGGLWPVLRQRPFSNIAEPTAKPKSIFIHAMNTEPLAADADFILEGQERNFQIGMNILKKLTDGEVHVCTAADVKSKALTGSQNVKYHRFSGPHPSGNVSTHIQNIDPIKKGDVIWYIEAQDVLRVADLFQKGEYPTERIVALAGEGVQKRVYAKTIVGTSLNSLLEGSRLENMRCLTGSILTGREVTANGFLGFYDSQITVIPEGGQRKLLGWLMPGFNYYTFSHTFASAFFPKKEYSLDTDENGAGRAIVLNHIYDSVVSLDVLTYFLIKAIIAGDIEEAEKLGILECDEEDFALCTFACPSKTDVGGIIREGLEIIEKEG